MAKQLKDILKQAHDRIKGVHASQSAAASTGKDPGVDYDPKAGDEHEFIAKHSVEKWDEPQGNKNQADTVKYSLDTPQNSRMGNKEDEAKASYFRAVKEAKEVEETKCNMTEAGKMCPVHEMSDCTKMSKINEEEPLDEVSSALLYRAKQAAQKKAGWLMPGDGGKGDKAWNRAKKFRDAGVAKEKQEKAAKAVKEESEQVDEVVVSRKMTPQEKAARAAYLKKHSEKLAGHDTGVNPKKSFKDVNTERGDYTSQPSKMGLRHAIGAGYYKNEEVEEAVSDAAKKVLGNVAKKHGGKVPFKSTTYKDGKKTVTHGYNDTKGNRVVTHTTNEEVEQIDEKVKTTHENPLVTVHDKDGLHTHANLSTANKIFNTKVKHTDVHAGPVKTKDGHETKNNLTFAISKHHASAIKEEAIDEVLTKNTSAGETISDFVHSKNPKFAGKSKEKRKQMALAAYYAKQRSVKESYAVEPLLGDYKPRGDSDEAVDMVKSELKALANKAMHLVANMPSGMHVEPWVQAKIAQSKSMVSDVHDYCIYGDHKENEGTPDTSGSGGGSAGGALVMNGTMDTPMTFPNMSVDVNTGQNV